MEYMEKCEEETPEK